MTSQSNILIIGAGVIGVCAAWYLTQSGYRPLVVDRGEVASGSSHANAGLLVPSSWQPMASAQGIEQLLEKWQDPDSYIYLPASGDPNYTHWRNRMRAAAEPTKWLETTAILRRLAIRSLELYRELHLALPLDDHFRTDGSLNLYATKESFRQGSIHALRHRSMGGAAALLDLNGVRHYLPQAAEIVKGAVLLSEDGLLSPRMFVQNLAREAERHGAEFRTNVTVKGIETLDNQITAVTTNEEKLTPDVVVLAAGAWSGELVKDWGLDVPVIPGRGFSYTVARPERFPDFGVQLMDEGVAVNGMGDQLRIAGRVEFTGMDDNLDGNRAAKVARASRDLLGIDPRPEDGKPWMGFRPMTPDGLPIVDWSSKHENLLLACGHNKIGMTLGPVTGELVTQQVTGAPTDPDLAALALDRFH